MHREHPRARDFLPALLLGTGSVLTVMLAMLAPPPIIPGAPPPQVAVAFAPWLPLDQTIARVVRAGGQVVRSGALPAVLVVQPDDAGFAARAKAAGAWLVANPRIAGGCVNGTSGPAPFATPPPVPTFSPLSSVAAATTRVY